MEKKEKQIQHLQKHKESVSLSDFKLCEDRKSFTLTVLDV